MTHKNVKLLLLLASLLILALVGTACGGAAQPEKVVETVVVEKEVKVVETVEVEVENLIRSKVISKTITGEIRVNPYASVFVLKYLSFQLN